MPVNASQSVTVLFHVAKAGQLVAPDALPAATLYRNGTAEAVTVTVTATGVTGQYRAAFTAGAWSAGDALQLSVSADIDAITYAAIVWTDTIASATGAGSTDWTDPERRQIRYRLGVDGAKEAPIEDSPVFPVTVSPATIIQVTNPTPDEAGHFYLTQRDDYENDADIQPIGPIRVETTLDLLRQSDPPTLRFGATQSLGRRYGDTHIVGTAYAVAVPGEANQYDLYVEVDRAELDKPAGQYGWDIESVWSDGDVRTVIRGTCTLRQSMGDHEARAAQQA